jgi:hypothetical protein
MGEKLVYRRGIAKLSAKAKKPTPTEWAFIEFNAGDHLISHTLSRAVPSAQRGLTSVFGMGTGGTLAVNSPANRDGLPASEPASNLSRSWRERSTAFDLNIS